MAKSKQSTGHVDKKATAKRGVTLRAASKIHHKSKKAVKTVHHHVAKRPHHYLHQKYSWYRRWHNWRWSNLVHYLAIVGYIFAAGLFAFNATNGQSYALSSWLQTNWDGGVGTSTSSQYAAATNIDNSTSGQLALAQSANSYTNPSFDSDISGWNGSKNSHDTGTKYSGTGSNKITAGGVSSLTFNNAASKPGPTNQFKNDSGDINGDGVDDVVVAGTGGVTVFFAQGDGTLENGVLNAGIPSFVYYDVKVVDVENDGDNDVIATVWGTQSSYSIFKNNGSGTLTRVENTFFGGSNTNYCAVEVLDINGDTFMDVAFACVYSNGVYFALNNGSGSYPAVSTAAGFPIGTGVYPDIQSGDINGDNQPDVAVSWNKNGGGGLCSQYYAINDGGAFSTTSNFDYGECGASAHYSSGISLGDLNEDGKDDAVLFRRKGNGGTSTSDGYAATILFGQSNGSFAGQTELVNYTGFGVGQGNIHIRDINNDGHLDIIGTSGSYAIAVLFKGNGDGTFQTREDYSTTGSTGTYGNALGDLNGDGRLDVIVGNYLTSGTPDIKILLNRTVGDALTQPFDFGNTDYYQMEGYVYTDGSAVTSADAQLYANGSTVTTNYAATATSGWYKLTGKVQATDDWAGYGVIAKQGKTVYVDDMKLFKYASNGSLTSSIYDLSFGGDWDTLTYNTSGSGTTAVKVRTGNASDMSDATDFSSCSNITSGTDLTGQTCVDNNDRYVQYQVDLTAVSGETPIFEDVAIQYDPYDNDVPITNASSISMSKVNGGSAVASNDWTNGASPYFAWTAGADNVGGSGVLGYCAYLGTDNSADPVTTKGLLGTSPTSNASCPFVVGGDSLDLATAGILQTALTTSNNPYYLNLKVIDVAGNVFTGSSEQFQFRFDNTPPTNPAFLTTPSQYISSKSTTMTWPTTGVSAPSDANSGVQGLQYQIESTGWYGDNHSGSGDVDDLLINDGTYTTTSPSAPDETNLNDGVNTVYLRTWDQAGNISATTVSAAIKINTSSAPSAPQGVGASPTTSTSNSFAFNWSEPSTFLGSASNLTYCYTVNSLPSVNNCTFTATGVTDLPAGAYANQPGENTFYVVAKDESGNINYSSYASVSFFANTPAPGIPLNTDIADVSVKSTSNWRLAITWDAPSSVGAGVQSYKIYRSTDNSNFSVVGSSSSTSYVDASLSQVKYYYRVKACDSANNCGADSSTVNKLPTGKFTSPAGITSEPKVSNVTTKRATIAWSTERDSDSKVAIGTTSNKYSSSEIGNSDQVTAHSIDLDNLAAGTTYYYKAKWTDEDGNTGSSQEYTFKTAPAPVLKEVDTISVGLSNATVEFTTKDAVKVDLNFGQNEAFGGVKTINTSAEESTYQIALAGLNDGTKYLYKISMYDSEGGLYPSSIFTFTTPPRPSISNLRFQPIKGEPTSTQKVTWTTNVPTTSIIEYTKIGASALNIQTSELKTSHTIVIKGLEDNSKYSLIAQGRDNAGNLAVSDAQVFETALDTRPPEISDIVIEPSVRGTGAESRGQIVVSWKTDEPSSSQVAFGEGSNVTTFNNRTAEDNQLTTEHLVIVSDLPPSKVYSIAPQSRDKAGNQTTAKSQAAIIGRATDSVLSIVLNTLKNVFGL